MIESTESDVIIHKDTRNKRGTEANKKRFNAKEAIHREMQQEKRFCEV